MYFVPATQELLFRERALQAAATAKLSGFADAYDPNPNPCWQGHFDFCIDVHTANPFRILKRY